MTASVEGKVAALVRLLVAKEIVTVADYDAPAPGGSRPERKSGRRVVERAATEPGSNRSERNNIEVLEDEARAAPVNALKPAANRSAATRSPGTGHRTDPADDARRVDAADRRAPATRARGRHADGPHGRRGPGRAGGGAARRSAGSEVSLRGAAAYPALAVAQELLSVYKDLACPLLHLACPLLHFEHLPPG